MDLETIKSIDIESEIAKLPIAYYAGRPISIQVCNCNASHYDFLKDCITVSKQQIEAALTNIDEKKFDPRTDIRPIPYHEVGHAILSPVTLLCVSLNDRARSLSNDKARELRYVARDIVNIFEDERIETLLATTFMYVDFKRNIRLISDYDRQAVPTSSISLFFQIVRLHYTPLHLKRGLTHYLQRVRAIIISYSDMSSYTDSKSRITSYCREIDALYFDIRDEFVNTALQREMMTGASKLTVETPSLNNTPIPTFSGSSEDSDDDETISPEDADSSDDKSNSQSEELSQSNSETILKSNESSSSSLSESDDSILSDIDIELLRSMSAFKNACREIASNDCYALSNSETMIIENEMRDVACNGYEQDSSIVDTATKIFVSKSKKFARSAAAIPCYSGVIEPRLIGRKDWRVWLNKSRGGAYRLWNKMHLNLFIDNSSSFSDNRKAVNRLICSLQQVEKAVPEFTFDVVRCDTSVKICDKAHRFCSAHGGTRFDDKIVKVYNLLQQKDAINYNVMLVDGDDGTTEHCYHDCSDDVFDYPCGYYNSTEKRHVVRKPYVCFNHTTDIIITDEYNYIHIEKQAPRAKIVSMTDRAYSSTLISIVLNCIAQTH
jgi:hypothetical protein